jgi:O-antigen/teichoic acid export membrane protein
MIFIKSKVSTIFSRLTHIISFKPHNIDTQQGISDERYRRILLTGGSTAIVKIFSATTNLITVPLTVNYLGAERYGLWMTISSIMALMSFADLGLGNGLLNAISRANGRNDINEAKIAVSSTFFMLLGIASILFAIFIILYPVISWQIIFNAQSDQAKNESGSTMFILVVSFLLNMPLGVVSRIQDGYQEGFKFQIWLIIGSIISLVGLLICIYLKTGLPWLVLAFSSGQLIAIFLNGIVLFFKSRRDLCPSFKNFDLGTGKDLVKEGIIFFMLGIFTLLGNSSDSIILSHTMSPEAVAGYEIVKKIFLFSMFSQFIIQPLWPAFAEAIEKRDIEWAKKTLRKGLFLSIGSGLIITLPLLIFGKQIIMLWVGQAYIPSWSLLLGFYFFVALANYGGVMSTFLNSGELLSKQTLFIGLASVSAVLLKIYLSFNFGVSGIIWATVISYAIFYVIPSHKIAFNYLKNKYT